jgi:hypothetical protein
MRHDRRSGMLRWIRRTFPTWTHVGEYLVFFAVCIAGYVNASWLAVPIGAMALLLLGWPRYAELFASAGKVDADWRELGALVRAHKLGSGLLHYFKARSVAVVLSIKLLHDSLFTAGVFLVGHAAAWLSGSR